MIEQKLNEAAKTAKTEPEALSKRIEGLLEEVKILQIENEKLKAKLANQSLGDVMKILNVVITPVLSTCVPPHNSFEKLPISTTRTLVPYFS